MNLRYITKYLWLLTATAAAFALLGDGREARWLAVGMLVIVVIISVYAVLVALPRNEELWQRITARITSDRHDARQTLVTRQAQMTYIAYALPHLVALLYLWPR